MQTLQYPWRFSTTITMFLHRRKQMFANWKLDQKFGLSKETRIAQLHFKKKNETL